MVNGGDADDMRIIPMACWRHSCDTLTASTGRRWIPGSKKQCDRIWWTIQASHCSTEFQNLAHSMLLVTILCINKMSIATSTFRRSDVNLTWFLYHKQGYLLDFMLFRLLRTLLVKSKQMMWRWSKGRSPGTTEWIGWRHGSCACRLYNLYIYCIWYIYIYSCNYKYTY